MSNTKLTREKVADRDILHPNQQGLRQARRDHRRGEIIGEAIGIMRSVYIVFGRYTSNYQPPPLHVLWRMELRMWVLMHEMISLQLQENNYPVSEEAVQEAGFSDD